MSNAGHMASKKAVEIQLFDDHKDMESFYSALKAVYGPTISGSSPLLSTGRSTLIADKENVLECRAEHSVLNGPSIIND